MKIAELLNEAVRVHSEGLLAWVITVAEAYAEKPAMVPQDVWHWQAMIFANQNLLSKALSKIKIIPVPGDPYEIVGKQGGSAENAMIADIVLNKQLKVFSGGSPHPVMSNQDNIMFRALHDFFAHAGSNAKSLKAFYDRQQLVTPQDAGNLPPFVLNHHSFTIRGEMNAYLTHTKLAPPDAWPALFTEIIGQASYYFVMGDFPEQKVCVLDGFDFRQLGVCTGARSQRMNELLAIIRDPNQPVIQTRVGNMVLDKRQINWKLLSAGTAGRQVESISEANMAHIWQKMQKGPFLVMSGWRSGLNRTVKRHRNAELRERLHRDYGLASITQRGFWPQETDEQGAVTDTGYEDSVFVPMMQPTSRVKDVNEFKAIANQLMIDYDQDSVLFNDGNASYFLNNPNRPEPQPPSRVGNGIRIYGKSQPLPKAKGWPDAERSQQRWGNDQPLPKGTMGWSVKGPHKYTVVER